jgi:uncharacterized membrane protein
MYSKIKIAGHPLHAMLVPFPVVLYTATLVCLITYVCTMDLFWFKVALKANWGAVLTAVLAALPGFIDWLSIPKNRKAKKVGVAHMFCNVSALLLFSLNLYLQCEQRNMMEPDVTMGIVLSSAGVILTVIAGFLGWSLVQKHHVGVVLTPEQQKIDPADGVN